MARKSRKHIAVGGEDIIKSSERNAEKRYQTAIYGRLSLEDSGRKDGGNSIENQVYIVKRYIEEHPYLELCATYVDNGETGTNFERPQFKALMEAVKAGTINCIAVKDLSRFGRNYIETGNFLEKVFPFMGVRFISVNDQYDSEHSEHTSECLSFALKNLVNDLYAKDISQKVIAALELKQKQGDFIGDYAPYGYLKSPENKNKLIPDKETAHIITNIFRWKKEGMSNYTIAQILNERELPTPSRYLYQKGIIHNSKYPNALWNDSMVQRILSNRIYNGCIVQGKTKSRYYQGIPKTKVPKEEWVIVENTHEPLISHELFDFVQKIMQSSYEKYEKQLSHHSHPENLVRGYAFCGNCGGSMKRYMSTTESTRYYCRNYMTHKLKGCNHKRSIPTLVLEESIWNAIHTEIELSLEIEQLAKKMQQQDKIQENKNKIQKQIIGVRHHIERIANLTFPLYNDYLNGILTESEYLFAKAKYSKEKQLLEEQLDHLVTENIRYSDTFISENKWFSSLKQFKDSKVLTRDMMVALVDRVTISEPNHVQVSFQYQDEYEILIRAISKSEVNGNE